MSTRLQSMSPQLKLHPHLRHRTPLNHPLHAPPRVRAGADPSRSEKAYYEGHHT